APGRDAQRAHAGEWRGGQPRVRGEVEEMQPAHAGELRGSSRGESPAAGRDGHQAWVATARREEPGARLDLHDRPIAERSDVSQDVVVAEHGAREKDAGEPAMARPARLVDTGDAAGETAGTADRARH